MSNRLLIIGGTSKLGYAICSFLVSKGYGLVITGRNEETLNCIRNSFDDPVEVHQLDLASHESIDSLFGEIEGPFDGMVYLAGMNDDSLIRQIDWNRADEMINVNYIGFLHCIKLFCSKRFSSEGASIVAISSLASIVNAPAMSLYSSSKAAMNSIVKCASKEYLNRKLRINAILPGYLESTMEGEERLSNEDSIQPFGRIPYNQISELVLFLLSDNSRYITGELICVSGGQKF